jgi:propionate catabolism operon transcriptional regulator
MNKIKIGCLTYGLLDPLARKAVPKINDSDIEVVFLEGLMENLVERVKYAHKNGVEIFVGGGANAAIIRRTALPVVNIQLTALDYIEAVMKAKELGDKIAIVNYQTSITVDIEKLKKITGAEIHHLVFQDKSELAYKLEQKEYDVVIGASLAYEIATSKGISGVLIYPGEEAIIASIKEAKQMAKILRKQIEKSRIFQSILEFSQNGILSVNSSGEVILCNPYAERILGINATSVINNDVSKVLPQLELDRVLKTRQSEFDLILTINDVEFVFNKILLEDDGNLIGAVSIFQKVSEIQKTEHKIRMTKKSKGFVAKLTFEDIIGKSRPLREEIEKAKLYAKTNSNILIYGETGVGKEVFAQSVHRYSKMMNGPFVAVNCASLPKNLLESELFGYDEGAFTGSKKGGKAGLFEIAHKGTIFLDEIGEITMDVQARLLRVIQEKEIMRVGGDRVIPIDVRIIAATNKKLEDRIPGDFREDLFYRLNVLRLNIPPLRERRDDVLDLFVYFINKDFNVSARSENISEIIGPIIKSYSWPGNIRELQNIAERFLVLYGSISGFRKESIRDIIISAFGEDKLFDDIISQHPNYHKEKDTLVKLVNRLELVFPRKKAKIAEKIGISRTTLWRKIN